MKIGIISSLPKNTGAYLRGNYFAQALMRQGHKVTYLNPQIRLPFKTDHILFPLINIFRYSFKRYDYLIVLKPFPVGTIPAIINRFLTGSKIVVDIDDLDSSYNEGFTGKFTEFIQKPFPKFFDLVTILDNHDLIKYVKKNWKVKEKKLVVIEQGVDIDTFDPELYQKNDINPDKKTFMFTGHLAQTSIVEVSKLLKIFKKLIEGYGPAKLMIVGGGPCLDIFRKKVKELNLEESVIFTGYVQSKDIVKYLLKADVCVCYYADRLSNYYRNSMKVREYLSMGKLVVCTNIGDLRKFKNYTIQTKATDEDFLKGMVEAYGKEESGKEAQKRREFIKKGFSWDYIAKKVIGAMEKNSIKKN